VETEVGIVVCFVNPEVTGFISTSRSMTWYLLCAHAVDAWVPAEGPVPWELLSLC
jgi:hypothetical protein